MVLTARDCRKIQQRISEVEKKVVDHVLAGMENLIKDELEGTKTNVDLDIPTFVHGAPTFDRKIVLTALKKELENRGFIVTDRGKFSINVSWMATTEPQQIVHSS